MDKHPFTPCAPFQFERLYGSEKYNLQNMLLREVNMPSAIFPDECSYEVWSDRSSATFWTNTKLITSDLTADAFFAGATERSFLAWATAVISEAEGKPVLLTGAALVRYTNVMSGYPTLRLTGVVATKDLDTREYGITIPRTRQFDEDDYYRVSD
jgi:hypothetical protein